MKNICHFLTARIISSTECGDIVNLLFLLFCGNNVAVNCVMTIDFLGLLRISLYISLHSYPLSTCRGRFRTEHLLVSFAYNSA